MKAKFCIILLVATSLISLEKQDDKMKRKQDEKMQRNKKTGKNAVGSFRWIYDIIKQDNNTSCHHPAI
jgi:hypothetical protein